MGPLGRGPCNDIRNYLMTKHVGAPQLSSLDLSQIEVIRKGTGVMGPICRGPLGEAPCELIAQLGLDAAGGQVPSQQSFGIRTDLPAQTLAAQCARRAGLDIRAFSACTGQQIVLPQSQQAVLDCAVKSRDTQAFANCAAPNLGIKLSNDQRLLAGCAVRARGDVRQFTECAGGSFLSQNLGPNERAVLNCASNYTDTRKFADCASSNILNREQKAVVDCAVNSRDAASFAACAAPNAGIKLSDDQRVLAQCALRSKGDRGEFASCAGTAFLNKSLGPKEQAVLSCAARSGGDKAKFASCAATGIFGDKMSREQKIAIECAAQSQGDPTGMATCAGANMFGLQLNPEQQIAVQCVVSTGGQPYAAAGCMASRLTARELTKCLTDGVGGRGCFGDTNDLVGKDGWVRRTLGQVAGGPNSVINNPNQIWGGDNSFVRNPGQIFGGSNSFVRNPSQIWGGPNSVFNNPPQLLPQPKPVQLGTVGGKRICLPWC